MAFGDAVSPRRLMCASALNADEAPFVVKKRNADSAFAHASGVSVPSSRGRACHGGGRRPSELKASSLIFPERAFFFVFLCLTRPRHHQLIPVALSRPSGARAFPLSPGVSSPWREVVGGHGEEERKEPPPPLLFLFSSCFTPQ